MHVGIYQNDDIGSVTASSYAQILPRNENMSFGTNPEVDSVRIRLYYSSEQRDGESYPRLFGDITQPMPFEVLEVDESFSTETYTAEDEISTGQVLGSTSEDFTPDPANQPAVYITLPVSFGERILEYAQGDYASFLSQIKGIGLKPSTENAGAVLGFRAEDSSRVEMYYHNDEQPDGIRTTLPLIEKRFNKFEADRSGTPFQGLTDKGDRISSKETENKVYFQSGTGLRAMLDFPSLSQFFGQKGDVIIDKAEFILPVDRSGVHSYAYEPPTDIIGFQTNENGRIRVGSDGSGATVPSEPYLLNQLQRNVFLYDFSKDAYVLDVTSYIQNIVHGDSENNPIILTSGFDGITAAYGVLLDQADEDNPLKFNVYFTE